MMVSDGQPEAVSLWGLIRRPSAFIPVLMSCAALTIVLAFIATHEVVRQPDEGAAAHLWQLLMAAQLPVILWFAASWLPRATRPALVILCLQAVAALAAMAPVFLLGL